MQNAQLSCKFAGLLPKLREKFFKNGHHLVFILTAEQFEEK